MEAIKLSTFSGEEFNLFDKYPHKALLLIIYNNQCLGCTGRAIPLAYEFQKEFDNLQVIGIHTLFNDLPITEADIKGIFTSGELPFPIYIDKNHKVYDYFKSEGTPQWIILDENRNVFRSIFGSQDGSQNKLYYALDELLGSNSN